MRQIIWTNFAISELKQIYFYYHMVAGQKIADKIRRSIFNSTKPLIKQPLIGAIEENLIELKLREIKSLIVVISGSLFFPLADR